jgi:hypothetical protein
VAHGAVVGYCLVDGLLDDGCLIYSQQVSVWVWVWGLGLFLCWPESGPRLYLRRKHRRRRCSRTICRTVPPRS